MGRDIVGEFFTTGEIVALRLTVLLKLLIPLIVIVKEAEPPFLMVVLVGVAVMEKSGTPLTTTETAVVWDTDPLVPVTTTV